VKELLNSYTIAKVFTRGVAQLKKGSSFRLTVYIQCICRK